MIACEARQQGGWTTGEGQDVSSHDERFVGDGGVSVQQAENGHHELICNCGIGKAGAMLHGVRQTMHEGYGI